MYARQSHMPELDVMHFHGWLLSGGAVRPLTLCTPVLYNHGSLQFVGEAAKGAVLTGKDMPADDACQLMMVDVNQGIGSVVGQLLPGNFMVTCQAAGSGGVCGQVLSIIFAAGKLQTSCSSVACCKPGRHPLMRYCMHFATAYREGA